MKNEQKYKKYIKRETEKGNKLDVGEYFTGRNDRSDRNPSSPPAHMKHHSLDSSVHRI